jgi:hypothetical protein
MKGSPAFRRLVEMCGLSTMFADHAMARAIVRAGIWPERMLASDIPAVIPEVERAIKPFLEEHEAELVVERIRASWWASGAPPPHAAIG